MSPTKFIALVLNTRNQAIDEAASTISSPEPDYEDWDSGERYAGRGDSSPDYCDMFSCLLERG